jgi:hypothetical protein
MLDLHAGHGYTEVLPPFIVSAESLYGPASCPSSPPTPSAWRATTGRPSSAAVVSVS